MDKEPDRKFYLALLAKSYLEEQKNMRAGIPKPRAWERDNL